MTKQPSHSQKTTSSVSLVIPLYNNEKTAKPLLSASLHVLEKLAIPYEILLCNDASSDTTEKIITQFAKTHSNIRVIQHNKNRGIAQSLKDLYSHAKNEYIILFSVDGGWDPVDIGRLIQYRNLKMVDIVIGERKEKKYSLVRKIISMIYNFLPYILFQTKTYDTGSIKIFRSEIFKQIHFYSQSVFFEAEMLIIAQKKGYSITSIPITHKTHMTKIKSGVNSKAVLQSFMDCLKLRIYLRV